MAANLSQARVSAYISIAYAVGKQIAGNTSQLQKFAGVCATGDTNFADLPCINTFINEFATLAFRTPPTAEERAELKKGASNWRTLIARVLVHPRFLLHFERDGNKNTRSGAYQLTDYELEARLTSVFWKSSPDTQGLAVAASGVLKTPAGLKAEVARILDSPKARDNMWNFYYQWLGVSRLPINGYSSGAGFEAFASPYTAAQLNNSFRDAVINDGKQYLEYLTWLQPSKLEVLFRSPLLFTTNATVASVYGVSPRANDAAAPVSDSTGHYGGLFTRQFITQQKPSNNGDINHILRGVFIMTNLMGKELGLPANFADQQQAGIAIPATSSTRFEVNAKTGIGACISCHSSINPAGYALGNFDSLGRYITSEKRFRSDNGGTLVATNVVDATTSLTLNGKTYQISDTATLTDALFDSGTIYQGFASYYFQYIFGRAPVSIPDQVILEELKQSLRTKTIREALQTLGESANFALAQTADL